MIHPLDRPIRRLCVLELGTLLGICLALITLLLIPSAEAAEPSTIFVTSYNPKENQTDASPCVGGSGRDLCQAAREGDRTIALSRDLLKTFRWHDKVRLTSDVPQCNGVYSVEDTLNKRFTKRADLFFLFSKDNTSCTAQIERVTYPKL